MATWLPLGATYSVNSLATTNAALIKAGPTQFGGYYINNTTAAAKFVRFYNKATAPVPGTDTPIIVITVPANSSMAVDLSEGCTFTLGLGVAITNAAPVLDATAVAAGDVHLTVDYI